MWQALPVSFTHTPSYPSLAVNKIFFIGNEQFLYLGNDTIISFNAFNFKSINNVNLNS